MYSSGLPSGSPSQHSTLPYYRDATPTSPPSSHDRFLNSANGYSRRKRPSTSSTDSLEISMGFKRLLAKPADPPLHRKSSAGLNQAVNNKSLSDSEGLVSANRRNPRPTMGMMSDTETRPRPTQSATTSTDQAHQRIQHYSPNLTPHQSLTRHSSRSPLPSHMPSLDHHLHAYLSDSSDVVIPKVDTHTHTPSKSRNVLRRKNSARDPLSAPTFEIVTPSPKRKPVPPADLDKLTPAGAVARAYMSQEKRREELAQSARSPIPLIPTRTEQSTITPQRSLISSNSGQLVAIGGPEDSFSRTPFKTSFSHPHSDTSLPLPSHNNSLPSLNSTASCCMYPSQPPSTPKEKILNRKRSLGLFSTGERKDGIHSTPNTFSSFSRDHGNHGNAGEFGQASRGNQSSSPISIDSPNSSGSGGGNKLWKLMKKISTGGLRDKFAAQEAPPVPALPLHLNISPKNDVMNSPASDNGHDHQSTKKKKSSKSKTRPSTVTVMTSSISGPSVQQVESPTPIEESNARPSLAEGVSLVYAYHQQGEAIPNIPFPSSPGRPSGVGSRPSFSSGPSDSRSRAASTTRRPVTNPLQKVKTNPSQTTLISVDSGVFSADDGEHGGRIRKNTDKSSAILGRHILPPSELTARMDPDKLQSSYSAPSSPRHNTEKHEGKGLPIPPRGRPISPEKSPVRSADDSYMDFDGRDSPFFPSFTVENAVNTFGPRSRPSLSARSSRSNSTSAPNSDKPGEVVDGHKFKSLKRRPSLKDIILPRGDDLVPKKSKSKRPATAELPSLATANPPTRPSRHPARPPPPSRSEDDRRERRHANASERSHVSDWTPDSLERPRSSSFSGHPSAGKELPYRSTSHHATPSQATFRPLNAKEVSKQLSEAEKAKRWDELLARSDRAGGTLHLAGVERLESDRL